MSIYIAEKIGSLKESDKESGNAEKVCLKVGCSASHIRKKLKNKTVFTHNGYEILRIAAPGLTFRSMWNGKDYYENVTSEQTRDIIDIDTFGGGWTNIRDNDIGEYRGWLISREKNIIQTDYKKYIKYYCSYQNRLYFGNVKNIMKETGIPDKYYGSIFGMLRRNSICNHEERTIYKTKETK